MSKNYYKYSMEYYLDNNYVRSIKCKLSESKIDSNSNIKAPKGKCSLASLGNLFIYDTLSNEGITFKFFFDTLERFLKEENVILVISVDYMTLHIETQRFTDRFYRIVDVYDFDFVLDSNCKSLLDHKNFYGRLKDILFRFKVKEIEYLNKSHTLMENQMKLRNMYECSFEMFNNYCKSGELDFDNALFSIEDYIDFCNNDTFRDIIVSDYFEENRDVLFADRELNSKFSKLFFNTLGAVNVKNNLKKKFEFMISDLKAKYFVMGYEDDVPKLKG